MLRAVVFIVNAPELLRKPRSICRGTVVLLFLADSSLLPLGFLAVLMKEQPQDWRTLLMCFPSVPGPVVEGSDDTLLVLQWVVGSIGLCGWVFYISSKKRGDII